MWHIQRKKTNEHRERQELSIKKSIKEREQNYKDKEINKRKERHTWELIWIAGIDIVFHDSIAWKNPSVVLDPQIID